ncbi:ABC transporter ATP-binding protein [Nesterenkonia alba]|uniref:ABC transporter ATP-binding protein n=1 Tax=Nesterenkonia alba TaxID=515814 RepID=UPI00040717F5|nr:oligopeptide/dipeptide ABC transporter ATP-binding protein [Nesterenkonia alba]
MPKVSHAHAETEPADAAPLLDVAHLHHSYSRRGGAGYDVLKDVSFQIFPGQSVGVVGESGCGKSTLARAILRLISPHAGSIRLGETDLVRLSGRALRHERRRLQMVFQDPFGSLDPRMTVQQLVEQPLHVHHIGEKKDRRSRAANMLADLGLGETFLDRLPKQLSGGQRQRVAIARALVLDPELTVLDEPISALDVSVQAQVLTLLREEQRKLGTTYLFIAHDLAAAEYFCDTILVLYLGQIVESGPATQVFTDPQHPYSASLISAAPDPRPAGKRRERIVLRGEPQAQRPERGCPFAPRCPVGFEREKCRSEVPDLTPTDDGRRVACHYPGELSI